MPENPFLIVVIPAFNEISLLPVLKSLKNASKTEVPVEIIVVFNASETASEDIKLVNQKAYDEVMEWKSQFSSNFFTIHPEIHQNLNPKKAGVGMARKIGMDQASLKLTEYGGIGVIVCLDADCIVDENYFVEIYLYFKSNSKIQGCNIYFEHRFEEGDDNLKEAIIQYEIHLRYYRLALEYCGFPYAFHTVGSSMAVTNDAYIRSKGMNTKKAGEDFYFLQKIFSQYPFGELNTTTVYPLGRLSDRVPFGTGAALTKWKDSKTNVLATYQFRSFLELKFLFDKVQGLKSFDTWNKFLKMEAKSLIISEYLISVGFFNDFEIIIRNTSKTKQLLPKFFRWFNNFRILKCLNYLRDTNYPQKAILGEAEKMLNTFGHESPKSSLDMLILFRNLDKNQDHNK